MGITEQERERIYRAALEQAERVQAEEDRRIAVLRTLIKPEPDEDDMEAQAA